MRRVLQKPPASLCRRRILRAVRNLDDHWLGDLIGAVCLFGGIVALFIIVGVLS